MLEIIISNKLFYLVALIVQISLQVSVSLVV